VPQAPCLTAPAAGGQPGVVTSTPESPPAMHTTAPGRSRSGRRDDHGPGVGSLISVRAPSTSSRVSATPSCVGSRRRRPTRWARSWCIWATASACGCAPSSPVRRWTWRGGPPCSHCPTGGRETMWWRSTGTRRRRPMRCSIRPPPWIRPRPARCGPTTLRWVLTHLIEEIARHAGHNGHHPRNCSTGQPAADFRLRCAGTPPARRPRPPDGGHASRSDRSTT